MIFPFFRKKIGFWGIFGPPSYGIGATIRIGREMLFPPYAGFFYSTRWMKEHNFLRIAFANNLELNVGCMLQSCRVRMGLEWAGETGELVKRSHQCNAIYFTVVYCTAVTLNCIALNCSAIHYSALHHKTLHLTAMNCSTCLEAIIVASVTKQR